MEKDEGFKPDGVELFLNGNPLSEDEYFIENGKVVLKKRVGSGTYELTGTLSKKNADTQRIGFNSCQPKSGCNQRT